MSENIYIHMFNIFRYPTPMRRISSVYCIVSFNKKNSELHKITRKVALS